MVTWPVLKGSIACGREARSTFPRAASVVACNHVSSFDPWPLGIPLWPSRCLRFMAKSELYWFPLSKVLDGVGAFPVRRGQHDTVAMETAVRLAREGHAVAMFPEGTRRLKGLVKTRQARPRTGAARIALEAGVPLVPAAVRGTDQLLRLGKLRVAYGAPVDDRRPARTRDRARPRARRPTRLMARIHELEASL